MLPLLLLLLPAAHGIGESSHAIGTGSGFPLALRGSPERRHQGPAEPGGAGQPMPPPFWALFWVSPLVSGVIDSGGLAQCGFLWRFPLESTRNLEEQGSRCPYHSGCHLKCPLCHLPWSSGSPARVFPPGMECLCIF